MAAVLESPRKVVLAVCRWSVLLQMFVTHVFSEAKKHDSSPRIACQLQLESLQKPPKLCSARSRYSAFGHAVPANWHPDVAPFIHYWNENSVNSVW